ncbi:MAG: hypothetical protein ACKOQM_05825 [Novosphingobium sp.]
MKAERNDKPPSSVTAVETVSILMLAVSVVFGGVRFDGDLIGRMLSLGFALWLVLKVTRRRSSRARLVLTVLAGLGFIMEFMVLIIPGLWAQAIGEIEQSPKTAMLGAIVGSGFTVVQLFLLWHPATTRWIEGRADEHFATKT